MPCLNRSGNRRSLGPALCRLTSMARSRSAKEEKISGVDHFGSFGRNGSGEGDPR